MIWNLLSETTNTTGTQGGCQNSGTIVLIVAMVVILAVMMFFTNRSNKKRQKEAEEKLKSLRVGDKVKTIGGICGVVTEIDDAENTFVLMTGSDDGVSYLKLDKFAVYEKTPQETAVPEAEAQTPPDAPFDEDTQPAEEGEAPAQSEDTADTPAQEGETPDGETGEPTEKTDNDNDVSENG